MYKKMKVYFPIWEEANVREAFAKFHGPLGYPKIIKSVDRSVDKTRSATPDYLLEDVDGNAIRTEVKIYSHQAAGYEDKIDLVICWIHDWAECPIKVLNLSEHIDDPHSFFKNLAIDIIEFVKNKDPSIEVVEQKYEEWQGSYFVLSKKRDQQEIFVKIKYEISDGLGYYICELSVPEALLQEFDKAWNRVVEDLLKPLQAEAFTVHRTTTGVGASETTKEIIVSKSYMAKDIMDPEIAVPRLSMDAEALFDFIKKASE
jgi:hypothetical protein